MVSNSFNRCNKVINRMLQSNNYKIFGHNVLYKEKNQRPIINNNLISEKIIKIKINLKLKDLLMYLKLKLEI